MTAQANYALLKYSRSYASDDPDRVSTQPTSFDSEWQHFSYPTLRLFFEEAHSTGVPRSAKLHITWVPVRNEPVSQGTVVLEDIDLLSFPPVATVSRRGAKPQNQSLPLKVVYRDSVVGFRYLYPRVIPAGSLPTYRRFQISFTDPSFAAQFVDSIRQICPCKASPPPTVAPAQDLTAKPSHNAAFSKPMQHGPKDAKTSSPVPLQRSTNYHSLVTDALIKKPQSQLSNLESQITHVHIQTLPSISDQSALLRESQSSFGAPPVAATDTRNSLVFPPPGGSNDLLSDSISMTQPSIPPSLSGRSVEIKGIDTSKTHNNPTASSYTPASSDHVRDACTVRELYAMPEDQLERFVGEVIREPGFLRLLEKLDAMWKVKGFIITSLRASES